MSTPPRATTAPTRNETPSPLMNADLAIDDSVYDDLRQYYKEGELVEIGLNCALDVGIGGLAATWHVTDDLSDDIRTSGGEILAPWGQPQLIVS